MVRAPFGGRQTAYRRRGRVDCMDTTGNSAALVEVPVDDGSIDRAIDELDARIAEIAELAGHGEE